RLIISRVIQGLAAGLFFPQINATIMDMYSGKSLGKIFGILGSVIGVGTAIGPLTGGLLIELFGTTNGWRAVFFVNVPFVLVTLVLAMLYLPKRTVSTKKISFDLPGVGLLTIALLLLLFPLISNGANDFKPIDYLLMALSIPLFIILYKWSVYQEKKGNQPLIAPNLLKNNQFVSGMLLSLVYFAAFTSIFFVLSLTWQTGFNRSAILSGLAISPFALGSVLAASNSYRFIPLLGRKLLMLGVSLVIVGLGTVSIVFHLNDGAFSAWLLFLPLFIAGLGSGLTIAPLNSFTLSTVTGIDRGGASGMFNTAQRIGSSFGIAVVGSVFFRTLGNTTATSKASAFSDSLQMSMYVNIFLLVVCFLLIFRLPKSI
ncbi:major facilitator family transporter, partial [Listeria innocua FSL S4-378]